MPLMYACHSTIYRTNLSICSFLVSVEAGMSIILNPLPSYDVPAVPIRCIWDPSTLIARHVQTFWPMKLTDILLNFAELLILK